ncbi:hypothetical protein ACHQM5_000221 [Ranunculus cassubicifolius]
MLSKDSGLLSMLPTDILLYILSRLPLKSLWQCRWVCKSWYNLIIHPRFAEIHYKWAMQNNSPCVLLHDWHHDFYLVDHEVFDNLETSTILYEVEFSDFKAVFHRRNVFINTSKLIGCVNGLICFSSDPVKYHPAPYYICNPITGEHITLPEPPKREIVPLIAAFGFDSSANEYKVIRLFQDKNKRNKNGLSNGNEGEVYTLGLKIWKRIEHVPYIADEDERECNIHVNGNLHWISHEDPKVVIVVFNVAAEKFNEFQPPLCVGSKNFSLGVIEKRLCLSKHKEHGEYEIWVMRDYGVDKSWTKEYNFRFEVTKSVWSERHEMIKLRNGTFLVQYGRRNLAYYDPQKHTLKPVNLIGEGAEYFTPAILVGSLFSPKDVGKLSRR